MIEWLWFFPSHMFCYLNNINQQVFLETSSTAVQTHTELNCHIHAYSSGISVAVWARIFMNTEYSTLHSAIRTDTVLFPEMFIRTLWVPADGNNHCDDVCISLHLIGRLLCSLCENVPLQRDILQWNITLFPQHHYSVHLGKWNRIFWESMSGLKLSKLIKISFQLIHQFHFFHRGTFWAQ